MILIYMTLCARGPIRPCLCQVPVQGWGVFAGQGGGEGSSLQWGVASTLQILGKNRICLAIAADVPKDLAQGLNLIFA